MNQSPVVDVVILSWNRSEMTIETIENVLAQEGVQPRVWVVDQGSESQHLNRLQRFVAPKQNVYLLELHKNLGVPGGRNKGMTLGEAPYIVSIDNDAELASPLALQRIVARFDLEPTLGVIGFRILNYYTRHDDELSWAYPRPLKSQRDQEFTATSFCGGAHAVRRSLIEDLGGYDADLFFYWEEVDLAYRVINSGYRIVYDPTIVLLHKVSPENRTNWGSGRFYYLVRNTIYLRLKYHQDAVSITLVALAYICKGFYNRIPLQALKGVAHAVEMFRQRRSNGDMHRVKLSEAAKRYIRVHDTSVRGSLWERIRHEVLEDLSKKG